MAFRPQTVLNPEVLPEVTPKGYNPEVLPKQTPAPAPSSAPAKFPGFRGVAGRILPAVGGAATVAGIGAGLAQMSEAGVPGLGWISSSARERESYGDAPVIGGTFRPAAAEATAPTMSQSEIDALAVNSPSMRQILMKSHPVAEAPITDTGAPGGGFVSFTAPQTEEEIKAPSFRRSAREPYLPSYDISGHGPAGTLFALMAGSRLAKGEYNVMANAQKAEEERNVNDLERFKAEQAATTGRMNARTYLQSAAAAEKAAEAKGEAVADEFTYAAPTVDEFGASKPGSIERKVGKRVDKLPITPEQASMIEQYRQETMAQLPPDASPEMRAEANRRAINIAADAFYQQYSANQTAPKKEK